MNYRTSWKMVVFAALTLAAVCQAEDGVVENYALQPGQGTGIAAAIDAAVATMNFVIRPVARSRLRENNVARQKIRIVRTASDVEITFDSGKPTRTLLDGTPIEWISEQGERSQVSTTLQGTQLVQTFKVKDGMRVNTFRWDADGKTLHLDANTTSERLPKPVSYTLTYSRVE